MRIPLIFEGQEILIPWPTATPPLGPIAVQVGEETIVVDPANCPPFYEIKEGDNLFQLAAERGIPLDAMLEINYRTIDSILKPGDIICIPEVTNGPSTSDPWPFPHPFIDPFPTWGRAALSGRWHYGRLRLSNFWRSNGWPLKIWPKMNGTWWN